MSSNGPPNEIGCNPQKRRSCIDGQTAMSGRSCELVFASVEILHSVAAGDVSRGPWKKNGALHSIIRVSYQAATSACSRTSLRRW